MNNTLEDIVIYTYERYPVSTQLGVSRLMKLLFIADWEYIRQSKNRLADFQWVITPAGPFSTPVLNILLETTERFNIESKTEGWKNSNIAPDIIVIFKPNITYIPNMNNNIIAILNKTIDKTYKMNWKDLWQHMNITTPFLACEVNKEIDLVNMLYSPNLVGTPALSVEMTTSIGHIAAKSNVTKNRDNRTGYWSRNGKRLLRTN